MAALPFIGKDIVKNENGIFIQNAEIVKPEKFTYTGFNPLEMEVRLYYHGQNVGQAVLTNVQLNAPLNGPNECKISATVIGDIFQ